MRLGVGVLLGLHVGGPVGQRVVDGAAVLVLFLDQGIDDVLLVAGDADFVELGALYERRLGVVLVGRRPSDQGLGGELLGVAVPVRLGGDGPARKLQGVARL